ncbi:MAG: hypothetical protein NXI31_00680 [bacterium]|nr:hypothetical protein [bacterium]
MFHIRTTSFALLTAFSLLSAAAAQSQRFSTVGAGCPGSNGTPTLSSSGVPTIGQRFWMDLANAPSSTIALLRAGLSDTTSPAGPLPLPLAPFGAPGCIWRNSAELALGLLQTSAAGAGSFGLPLANNTALIGLPFHAQFFVIDPPANQLGATVTNGAKCTIGQHTPMVVTGASSTTVAVGGTVSFTARNVDPDPANTCWRLMWPDGDTAVLIAQAVQQTPNGQTVVARLGSMPQPHNFGQPATLGVFRGDGAQNQPIGGSAVALSAPGESWAWTGTDRLDNRVMTQVQLTVPPVSGQRHYVTYGVGATDIPVVVGTFPATPLCPLAPVPFYRQGWTFLTDIHFNMQCDDLFKHYDFFMKAVTVMPAGGLDRVLALSFHAAQIQNQLNDKYPGEFVVKTDFVTNEISVEPLDPNCIILSAGGKTVIEYSCL